MPNGSRSRSVVRAIAELPFHERPVLELLNLVGDRSEPDADYAGYGWARISRLWLAEHGAAARSVDDVLLLALHCPDDGEALGDDIELYFELPEQAPVTVLASMFFADTSSGIRGGQLAKNLDARPVTGACSGSSQ